MIADVVRNAQVLDIRRVRKLPFPGEVWVEVGQSVHTGDEIARGMLASGVSILDIAKGLGVSPSEVQSCLVCEPGEVLMAGDIVAQCEGTFPRLVRAPMDGKFLEYYQGQVVLTADEQVIRCQAGLIGEVVELIPEYGAILTASGSLIQGVWGNGRVAEGILNLIDCPLETPLETTMLDSLETGHVLAAGNCQDEDVLRCLQDKEMAGVILGSLAPGLIPIAQELPMPMIVLSGFGSMSADPVRFNIFQSHAGEVVSVNASQGDIVSGTRPEVIIPALGGDPEKGLGYREKLSLGQRVQVLSGPSCGSVGELVELSKIPGQFESGLVFLEAVVKLENEEMVTVPSQNLVILG